MPIVKIPVNAKSLNEFSTNDRETISRLDEIFWNELKGMECGRMISEVRTVGGLQKAEAIEETSKKLNAPLDNVMYVGDSITDVEAFRLVRDNGGLTVSFNGNSYAVNNAEIAVLSESSIVTAVIADMFCKHGKPRALQLALDWDIESLKNTWVSPILLEHLFKLYPGELPKVQIVTDENREELAKESSEFRKKVRGESVGRLG
jgi:energy-converting hydrogenase A subunit R